MDYIHFTKHTHTVFRDFICILVVISKLASTSVRVGEDCGDGFVAFNVDV